MPFEENVMRNACLLLVALMCLAVVCHAQGNTEQFWETGNGFLRICNSADKLSKDWTDSERSMAFACLTFLEGLRQGVILEIDLSRSTGHGALFPFCVPEEIEGGQEIRVLLKYLRDNPAKTHLRTAPLFAMAMKDAFPCPEQK